MTKKGSTAGQAVPGLWSMFLLLLEYENGLVPDDMRDLPYDLLGLFELLDVVEGCKE